MPTVQDAVTLIRQAMNRIDSGEDKEIFREVVRNAPGPSAPIIHPINNGFVEFYQYVSLSVADRNLHVKAAQRVSDDRVERLEMFNNIVSTVHKLANHYDIYIGRTFIKKGQESKGFSNRFKSHRQNMGVKYGRALFNVSRDSVRKNEELAIILVDIWNQIGALCCNNKVLLSNGPLNKNSRQLIYICLCEKG
jgi:hypothetical protein